MFLKDEFSGHQLRPIESQSPQPNVIHRVPSGLLPNYLSKPSPCLHLLSHLSTWYLSAGLPPSSLACSPPSVCSAAREMSLQCRSDNGECWAKRPAISLCPGNKIQTLAVSFPRPYLAWVSANLCTFFLGHLPQPLNSGATGTRLSCC